MRLSPVPARPHVSSMNENDALAVGYAVLARRQVGTKIAVHLGGKLIATLAVVAASRPAKLLFASKIAGFCGIWLPPLSL